MLTACSSDLQKNCHRVTESQKTDKYRKSGFHLPIPPALSFHLCVSVAKTHNETMKNSQTSQAAFWRSDATLLMLALVWGTSHVIQKDILSSHSPAFYTSARFGIA